MLLIDLLEDLAHGRDEGAAISLAGFLDSYFPGLHSKAV